MIWQLVSGIIYSGVYDNNGVLPFDNACGILYIYELQRRPLTTIVTSLAAAAKNLYENVKRNGVGGVALPRRVEVCEYVLKSCILDSCSRPWNRCFPEEFFIFLQIIRLVSVG